MQYRDKHNYNIRLEKHIKHWEYKLTTYVYNHFNICKIPIYFYNIHMKHLQHTYKTSETLETYAWNIRFSSFFRTTHRGGGMAGSGQLAPEDGGMAWQQPAGLGPTSDGPLSWLPGHTRRSVPTHLRGYCWRAWAGGATREEEVAMEGGQRRPAKEKGEHGATNHKRPAPVPHRGETVGQRSMGKKPVGHPRKSIFRIFKQED
jgi:hypothetical protein